VALNDRQKRFVAEYLVDLNATKAAIRAGYSENTSYSIAHELLKKPEIQDALAEEEKARSKRLHMSADRVEEELANIALSDETPVGVRVKALELLGKRHALFTDKVQHDSSGDIHIRMIGLPDKTRGDGRAHHNG
jgi:phage terminase small subunit